MILTLALREGRSSSVELTEAALARAQDEAGEGARVFTRLYAESALAQARASDTLRAAGIVRSAVEGLPISIKDLFDIEGETTMAGSVAREGEPAADANAEVVRRLIAAGAVIIGRTNMTEFAYSGLGINPHYGTPLNPTTAPLAAFLAVHPRAPPCRFPTAWPSRPSARIPAARCAVLRRCAGSRASSPRRAA